MTAQTAGPPGGDGTDYDLHGGVAIRLVDAGPAEIRMIDRQLGPLRGRTGRPPDLSIRFVDRLPTAGPIRFLGHEEAGFSDDAYLVLRGRHKSLVRVALPLDRIGHGPTEIIAERGAPAIPLLVPMLNLVALANGLVPIHGAAFLHDDLGVLTVGWAKGGKSETLLAFTSRGARYVADEWAYVDPSGLIRGLPEPMRVWAWQLASMPRLEGRVQAADRRRLAATGAVATMLRAAGRAPVIGRRAPGRLANRARALVERQLSVQVPPERLLDGGVARDGASLDRLVLIMSHDDPAITVEPADAGDIARRATESFMFETADLLGHYRRFRFAFPDRQNAFIEDLAERHRAATEAALRDVPALLVRHPYPLDIPRLYDAIAPRLR